MAPSVSGVERGGGILDVAALEAGAAESVPEQRLAGAGDLVDLLAFRGGERPTQHGRGALVLGVAHRNLRGDADRGQIVRAGLDGALGGGAGAVPLAGGKVALGGGLEPLRPLGRRAGK
jgi:hypothetical protein